MQAEASRLYVHEPTTLSRHVRTFTIILIIRFTTISSSCLYFISFPWNILTSSLTQRLLTLTWCQQSGTGWNQQPTSVRSVRTDTWRQIKLSPFSFCKQDETEEETTGTEHVPSQLSLFWTHWRFPVKHWRPCSIRSYWSCFLWLIWSVIVLLLARHSGTRTTKRFSWRLQPQPAGGRRDGRKEGREKEGWGWRDEKDDRRRKTRKSGGKEVTWRREER